MLSEFKCLIMWMHATDEQVYSNEEKAEVWVRVAEAYLENDEADAADNFCSKV